MGLMVGGVRDGCLFVLQNKSKLLSDEGDWRNGSAWLS